MPIQPNPARLRVGSPADLLAIVPHLLGFIPGNSFVVLGARGPRHRIELTLRFDLPDPPEPRAAADIAAHAVAVLGAQQLTTVIAIGYGPGLLVTPLADAIRQATAGTDLTLRDVLRVEHGRYWSYLCPNPLCCPPAGVPFTTDGHPAAVAMAATPGHQVLASRDDLAATIAPVTGPTAEAMRRETARAERIATRLIARTAATGNPARPVIEHGLKAVQAAITTYRDGGTIELPGQFAWLSVALTHLWVRDDAWARMDPAHRDAHLRLWTDLTRHAQPGYLAAPACLLAFTAWQTGNGALANLALDRALADQPGYSMALLLRDTIDAGTPPSLAVLPMTPEEVAASYTQTLAPPASRSGHPQGIRHCRRPGQLTVAASTGPAHRAGPRQRGLVVCPGLSASQARSSAQPASRSARSTRSRSFPRARQIQGPAPPDSPFPKPLGKHLARPGQPVALPPSFACVSSRTGTPHNSRPRHRHPHPRSTPWTPPPRPPASSSPATAAAPKSPLADTYYVDGAGQLCTTTCTSPLPRELLGIEPPF